MNKKIATAIVVVLIILIGGWGLSRTASESILSSLPTTVLSVPANEFKDLIDSMSTEDKILDVRTLEEYSQGHIEGATLLNFYSLSFKDDLSLLDKDTTWYIYCRSGNRSGQALKTMKKLGFTEVYNLEGGINTWIGRNYPVVLNNAPVTESEEFPLPEWAVEEASSEEKNTKTIDYVVYEDITKTKDFYDTLPGTWTATSEWEQVDEEDEVQKSFTNDSVNILVSVSKNKLCISKTTLTVEVK